MVYGCAKRAGEPRSKHPPMEAGKLCHMSKHVIKLASNQGHYSVHFDLNDEIFLQIEAFFYLFFYLFGLEIE